jgi:hypothetical protein
MFLMFISIYFSLLRTVSQPSTDDRRPTALLIPIQSNQQKFGTVEGGRWTVDFITLFGVQKYVKTTGGQGKGGNLLIK